MFNLLAYGSLLDQAELAQQTLRPPNNSRVIPVVLHGFRRRFNQEPSWRVGQRRERAVLNVEPLEGSSLNAILLAGIDARELAGLDEREQGYHRVSVPDSQIGPFSRSPFCRFDRRPLAHPTYVYCGKPEKRNNTLLPNNAYLQLCLRGALQWGQDFHDMFLQSTFIGEHACS